MILLKTIRINKRATSRIPGIHNARRSMASAWYRGGNSQRDKVSLGVAMARTKTLDLAMCLTVQQYENIPDFAYSLSLACRNHSSFAEMLPKPNALMQAQLRVSQGQLNRKINQNDNMAFPFPKAP
jgi:hypothetical protein